MENFYYKLSLIEQYQASASLGTNNNSYISGAQALWQSKLDSIITNFDGYEYYLYYSSASTAWPKTNTEPPFINYTTTSTSGSNWLTSQSIVAQNYDESNKDALVYSIPPYLRDDPNNSQFELFVEMIGQHFDIVWTYTKDITNRYNADNRLDYGISKDLVADVLRDFGIKIYQNNFSTQNLYSTLLGITPSGSLINIPNSTLTLPASTGYEYLTTVVTASLPNEVVPLEDANKELYKRIYHNLPLLLKKKGTTAGLKLLLNLYGVPDTILRINEFGGQDKLNTGDWDNWQDTFNYAIAGRDAQIITNARLYPTGIPSTIMLRFKTPDLTTLGLNQGGEQYFAILAAGEVGPPPSYASALLLEYSGSGLTSGSYSGSTVDPYYQYGTLKWIPNTDSPHQSTSASIYLPFFNQEWWSVMITLASGSVSSFNEPTTSSLYAKQKGLYQGNSYILYEGSSSVLQPNSPTYQWQSIYVIPTEPVSLPNAVYTPMSDGRYQELRYYNTQISESIFDDVTMNPLSIEGNATSGSQSSYSSLRFRASLGADQVIPTTTTLTSTHPSVTGSYIGIPSASFSDGTITYTIDPNLPGFVPNTEYIYQAQPNAGIQIAVSDKIKITNNSLPLGNTLSGLRSLQQLPLVSQSYTSDVNYVEVAFSPQDEINDDIIDQLGYFNVGQYIGDPRFESSSLTSYPDLNTLRDQYFAKYIRNYDLTDYLRLIKFFDNSLFKMIKDFVPARTGLATGAIIKQHLLERNRVRPPQASWEDNSYTASVSTLSTGYAPNSKIYTFSGSTGGTLPYLQNYTSSGYYPPYINISQSWDQIVITPSGSNTIVHNTLEEFYNGEFEGTAIQVADQSLLDPDCEIFLEVNVDESPYIPVFYNYQITQENTFLAQQPALGEINIYYTRELIEEGAPDRPSTTTS